MQKPCLIVRKNGKVAFRSFEPGLKSLAVLFFNKPGILKDADVFDKVVGEAAARLFVMAKVKSVEAGVASEKALERLEGAGVPCEASLTAERICAEDGKGHCEMEKLSQASPSDEAFLKGLSRAFLKR